MAPKRRKAAALPKRDVARVMRLRDKEGRTWAEVREEMRMPGSRVLKLYAAGGGIRGKGRSAAKRAAGGKP